jgi:pimeloyl-ACP methyl ester carboxylesterase
LGLVRLEGGRAWGWDGLVPGERSVLRIVPEHQAAVVLMTNSSAGRAIYRSLFPDLMWSLFARKRPRSAWAARWEWVDVASWSLDACADDVRAFCHTLGIDKPIVYGHSIGVPVALL